ncbi:MAG TPA: DUF423 domain-containing protein [Hansschlegelia sp.]
MSRSALILIAVAGVYGALGVATAAAGAHMSGDPRLATVATFLMLHAAALPAVAAAGVALGLGWLALAPAWGLALGTLLFCGDLLVRVIHGSSPLPIAAPTGGTILILSWLALTVGAVAGAIRRRAV